ncbi:MAG: DNA-binding protein YbiB [Caldimonas sp.]
MTIAHHIREIGRGKDGARSLGEPEALDLMSQVLDGHLTDLEIGAFAIAMRIKGESIPELSGFLSAVHARCLKVHTERPTVVLPSYNGARKLPNLTALLALLLSQEGIDVLVHGVEEDAGRVTTASIFRDLGLPVASNANEVDDGWSRREPVFISIDALCPPLARLLAVRRVIGLRNSGHTLAKLLTPCTARLALQVTNYTHPEYANLLHGFLGHIGANAMLLRGTEGEPVADPRRDPKLDVYIRGVLCADLSRPAQAGVLTALPLLPQSRDAPTTALYIQSVVSGEKPAPPSITRQVDCIVHALGSLDHPASTERSA